MSDPCSRQQGRAEECYEIHGECLEKNSYKELDSQKRGDKEIALAAVFMNGKNLRYSSKEIQNDKEVVLVACQEWCGALKYASSELQHDKEVVLMACSQYNANALKYASKEFFNDKDVVLKACSQYGLSLKLASQQLRNDKEVVLEACSKNGGALAHASQALQNNKEVVLAACSKNGGALQFASEELQNDKEVVLVACSRSGDALQFASRELQNDKEVVLTACSKNGSALQYASKILRANSEVVMTAVKSKPESLKFALEGLNQDRSCLIEAGLWDDDHVDRTKISRADNNDTQSLSETKKRKIVLSTKFSLAAESSAHATKFTIELKKHPYINREEFAVYSPNAFNKGTCDPNWTDKNWPCRGTFSSCQKPVSLKTGAPKEAECCWRYSFRYHLEEACRLGGFMIQVVDKQGSKGRSGKHTLGDGQAIEKEMAQDVGIKIFQFFEPPHHIHYSGEIERLVSVIEGWYKEGCNDMAECQVRNGHVTGARRKLALLATKT